MGEINAHRRGREREKKKGLLWNVSNMLVGFSWISSCPTLNEISTIKRLLNYHLLNWQMKVFLYVTSWTPQLTICSTVCDFFHRHQSGLPTELNVPQKILLGRIFLIQSLGKFFFLQGLFELYRSRKSYLSVLLSLATDRRLKSSNIHCISQQTRLPSAWDAFH